MSSKFPEMPRTNPDGHYLPFAGDHSIQEAVVGIHFREMPAPEVVRQARDTTQAELAECLPKAQEIHREQIKLVRKGQDFVPQDSISPRLVGFERSRVKADGTPAEVLRFLENTVTVSFLEYPGWKVALGDSLDYLRKVLSPLNLTANPVAAFSLRYIDRYTFDGPDDGACAEKLLRQENAYITPYSFSAGSFWHSHSGWLDTHEKGGRMLNQVNVGSALVDQASTITIDHNAICQLKAPRQSMATIFQSSDNTLGIEEVMSFLHGRNVTLLCDMLQPTMAEKIGLRK